MTLSELSAQWRVAHPVQRETWLLMCLCVCVCVTSEDEDNGNVAQQLHEEIVELNRTLDENRQELEAKCRELEAKDGELTQEKAASSDLSRQLEVERGARETEQRMMQDQLNESYHVIDELNLEVRDLQNQQIEQSEQIVYLYNELEEKERLLECYTGKLLCI